jgi:hypothetical protein
MAFILMIAPGAFAQDPNAVPTAPIVQGPAIETVTRLIYANNHKPEMTEPELAELIRTFKKDFGYLNYEVKKTEKATLKFDETVTQDLGNDLIFIVRNLGIYKEQRKVWLELWFRGKKVFGAFSLFPTPAKPVLIKGPNTDEGTYIIMLSLAGEEAAK